jgi:hypothetical protein
LDSVKLATTLDTFEAVELGVRVSPGLIDPKLSIYHKIKQIPPITATIVKISQTTFLFLIRVLSEESKLLLIFLNEFISNI